MTSTSSSACRSDHRPWTGCSTTRRFSSPRRGTCTSTGRSIFRARKNDTSGRETGSRCSAHDSGTSAFSSARTTRSPKRRDCSPSAELTSWQGNTPPNARRIRRCTVNSPRSTPTRPAVRPRGEPLRGQDAVTFAGTSTISHTPNGAVLTLEDSPGIAVADLDPDSWSPSVCRRRVSGTGVRASIQTSRRRDRRPGSPHPQRLDREPRSQTSCGGLAVEGGEDRLRRTDGGGRPRASDGGRTAEERVRDSRGDNPHVHMASEEDPSISEGLQATTTQCESKGSAHGGVTTFGQLVGACGCALAPMLARPSTG